MRAALLLALAGCLAAAAAQGQGQRAVGRSNTNWSRVGERELPSSKTAELMQDEYNYEGNTDLEKTREQAMLVRDSSNSKTATQYSRTSTTRTASSHSSGSTSSNNNHMPSRYTNDGSKPPFHSAIIVLLLSVVPILS